MVLPDHLGHPDHLGYRSAIESGRIAFAHLIRLWHARNGWSQRILPALADALDVGRVHNSQLSMLRNGKLASPGPEVFLALGSINLWLAREAPEGRLAPERAALVLAGHPELIEALQTSALPVRDASDHVLGSGDLLEVFVGLRPAPPAFDLRIDDSEAAALSAALATLLTAGRPWRQCREAVMAAYPVPRRQRRERFAEVMAGQRDYSAGELDAELPDLRRTLEALGGAGARDLGPDQFLALLRRRARHLGIGTPAGVPDLGDAIRRQLREASD
ncbi:MAG: hypothetical protein ACKOXO_12975 [Cyanobium sp.]